VNEQRSRSDESSPVRDRRYNRVAGGSAVEVFASHVTILLSVDMLQASQV
jgi:hypothetical protein